MAQKATQGTRHIAIETPLGKDVLLLRSFSGREEVSRLFELELDLLSEDYDVDFDKIVGENVTITLELPDGDKRYWNGYISRFGQGGGGSGQFAEYQATLVPWPWLLTRTSDCRIFQEMKVPDIIKKVCSDLGFTDIEDRLSGGYRTWEYCVQYRETAFNFISRLMEQEGIYYYFEHEPTKHKLVLCDSLSKHDTFGPYDKIKFNPEVEASSLAEKISDWSLEREVQPGKFAHTDYNFKTPKVSLLSKAEDVKRHGHAEYEIFDYPGEHPEKPDGDRYAKIRSEELAQPHETCNANTEARGVCPGYRFALEEHPRNDQNREYLILSADYHATASDYETSAAPADQWACSFQVMPSSVQFRPTRTTPKPVVQGTQTAVVTGPPGEEIWPDEYGRVKVHFYWDRHGPYDENSSCWIRVSHIHAGKSFGGIDIPRVGEEVIVSFLEGDPDHPIVTGRVYNADLMPPFGLPGKKVVSGLKTNSTKGGGGYNEMSMDDTKGAEKVTIHAQYDMGTTVEHDDTQTVHNNRTITVNGTHTETIKKDTKITITEGNFEHHVQTGTAKYTVKGAVTEDFDANQETKVANDIVIQSETKHVHITAATDIKLEVGGSKLLMKKDGSIELSGKNIAVKGSESVSIKGMSVTSQADADHNTKGAIVLSEASGSNTIKGGMVMLNP